MKFHIGSIKLSLAAFSGHMIQVTQASWECNAAWNRVQRGENCLQTETRSSARGAEVHCQTSWQVQGLENCSHGQFAWRKANPCLVLPTELSTQNILQSCQKWFLIPLIYFYSHVRNDFGFQNHFWCDHKIFYVESNMKYAKKNLVLTKGF